MPKVEKIYDKYRDKGLEVLVFSTDKEGPEKVAPYFEKNPTTLSVLIDRYNVTSEKFGVKSLPTLFLVGKSGNIVYKEVGSTDKDLVKLVTAIEKELTK